MTDQSDRVSDRFSAWARTPRGGALLAALLTLAILLPLWMFAVDWYRTELLSAGPTRQALLIFEAGGLIGMALFAGLVYLSVNRQAQLSQAVRERTREITRINQRLEEDLAQRQRVEAELRSSEARSQALLNAIPDLMFRLDRHGRFLDYHADESEMVLPPSAVIGGNIRQLPAAEAVIEGMLKKIEAALETHHIQTLEYSLPTAGGLKDFEARIVAGGPAEVVAIVRDITERQQAERSLHRWAHIFEHAEWGVAIGSADGRTLEMMNPAYARMHGFTVEELSHMPIDSVFAPGTADELSALIRTANETGHAVIESQHIRKDGTIFPVLVDLTAVRDANGELLYRVANVQDITERKRSEEELRRSQQQYEQLVNSIDGIVWEGDAHTGVFTLVSPAAERILGYPVEHWLTQPAFWADHLHPDDRDWVVSFCAAETAALRPHECEYRMLAADGRGVWLRETVSVTGENNRPQLLRGMMLDITQRKQVEEALREREEQYRSIFEASLDGLFINSLDGYVVDVNPAGARMHGYTVEECRGLRSELLVPPDRLSGLQEFLDTARSGGQFRARGFDRRKDGSQFPVDIVGTQFIYRGEPHALAVVRDITDYVHAEQALHERELQYRSVFESSMDGLFINSLDGQLVDFNPAAAHMHGYTVEEFRHLQPPQFVHPDSLHLFAAFMEAVQAGREYRCRAVDVRKDSSTFHIEVVGTPFTLRGQPHAFAIVRDISAQVEAEEALERRVGERTRELSTLLDVSRNVASTLELEPLLGLILDALKVFVDYSSARINTLEGQVLRVRAARGRSRIDRAIGTEFQLSGLVAEEVLIQRRVLVISDLAARDDPWAVTFRAEGAANIDAILTHVQSWMGVPLVAKGRVIGNLSLEHEQPGFYDAHHAEVVLALADQVAVALENARLFAEAQGKAVLEERQRLARDLHDSVTQSLYSLTLLAEAGRRLIDVDVPQAARYVSDMGEIAQQSLKEMRLLVYQLRPLALEHEGLIGALQARLDSVEKRAGVEARFLIEGNLGSLPPAIEEGLFRVVQEALNNALKHAAARSVVVRLRGDDECVTLEVTDDGRGSALLSSDVQGGLGLTSMRERVAQLEGTLAIESTPGQGTRVAVEVPRMLLPKA